MGFKKQKAPPPEIRNKREVAFSFSSGIGSAPGTMVLHPELAATRSIASIMAYDENELIEQPLNDLSLIPTYLAKYPVTWLNINGLGDLELLEKIGHTFNLHSLAMEDVVNIHQRPKIEEYDNLIFAVTRMPSIKNDIVKMEQLSIFWSKNFVITFQARGDCLNILRERIKHGGKRKKLLKAEYLAYTILDSIVDSFFPIFEYLGIKLDAVEETAILRPSNNIIINVHHFKHDLQLLRRALWSQREGIHNLKSDGKFTDTDMRFFLRDCEDHIIQLLEIAESYRERASGLIDIYLSSVSNKMNQIMKVLTIMATIFMPLSWICSIYGMNFNYELSPWNMPELEWYYGYPFAWGIMLAVTISFLIFFWRKGWLRE